MCNCTQKPDFKANIREAYDHTQTQKEQYVVYNSNDKLFIAPLSFVLKQNHCCYFVPKANGEFSEVKIEKTVDKDETKEVKRKK